MYIHNIYIKEQIWHHTFHTDLKIDPKQYSVLLAESPLNAKLNKEKMRYYENNKYA